MVLEVTGSGAFHSGERISSAYVEIDDDGVDRYWNMNGTGGWRWSHDGPVVHLTAGWHTLKIKYREQISIEAIFIERQP